MKEKHEFTIHETIEPAINDYLFKGIIMIYVNILTWETWNGVNDQRVGMLFQYSIQSSE